MNPQASHINKLIIALSVTMRAWRDKMDSFKGCNINSKRDTPLSVPSEKGNVNYRGEWFHSGQAVTHSGKT